MSKTNLIPHESYNVRRLRFNIVKLTLELEDIENQINTFNKAVYAFDREYQNRLGDLAEAVLALRIELGMADEDNKSQYGEASPVTTHLAEREHKLLKIAFRQAAKLCHPDYLTSECREIGLQLFDTLNKAYHLQDLVTVEHILWLLQSGQAFSVTTVIIKDTMLLEKRNELLGYLIEQNKDKLSQMKIKEEYDVSNRDNWNILLYDYQTQLEDELAILRARTKHSNRS